MGINISKFSRFSFSRVPFNLIKSRMKKENSKNIFPETKFLIRYFEL